MASYNANGGLNWDIDYLSEITNGLEELGRVQYRVRQMQSLTDGNILITGTTGYGGLMLKVEPDGNLLWFREHLKHPLGENDVISEHTHIYHTTPTSDGGFLSTGQYRSDPGNIYPTGIQTAIALKVDEYGCLEEGCGPTEAVVELAEGQGLVVYPNPNRGKFSVMPPITFSGKVAERSQSAEVTVLDIHGRVVLWQSSRAERRISVGHASHLTPQTSILEIDLTSQPSGLYLVRLTNGKEVLTTKIIKE